MGWKSQILVSIGLAMMGGCITTENHDKDPSVERSRIIGRTYVVGTDAKFVLARPWPGDSGWRPDFQNTVDLPGGTRVQITHAEIFNTVPDPFYFFDCLVEAVVQDGPHKGNQITFGNFYPGTKYAWFAEYDNLTGPDSWNLKMYPIPEKSPSWLDVSVLPPVARSPSLDELRSAVVNGDWAIRYYALSALTARDPFSDAMVNVCCVAIEDNTEEVCDLAIANLQKHGLKSNAALDALIRYISDPQVDNEEATKCCDAIVSHGPDGMAACGKLLESDNQTIWGRSLYILGKFGPAARGYIPKISRLLQGEPSWITDLDSNDYDVIGQIDAEAALKLIEPYLKSDDANLRCAAALKLELIYGDAVQNHDRKTALEIVNDAEPLLNDPVPWTQGAAQRIVSQAATQP